MLIMISFDYYSYVLCMQFQEQFNNDSTSANNVIVRLSLHSGQPIGQDSQIIPSVFTVEFLSNANSLTSEVVTRSIISSYNSYSSFEEFSDTVEPPELAEIAPNGIFH